MIDNPYEKYPWDDSPRDRYEVRVREDIESEMYHYDPKYVSWLLDAELIPTEDVQFAYDVNVNTIIDLLNENQKIRDAYYLYREDDVFKRYIND